MASETSRWTNEFLQPFRAAADPLADNLVAEIYKAGQLGLVNRLMNTMRRNGDIAEGLPPKVAEYFRSTAPDPASLDQHKIFVAEELFHRFGPRISMILFLEALPLSYSCKSGARVLYITGRLMEHKGDSILPLQRRIMETAQFVINVMSPNGFKKHGTAIITAQKIRLIHAMIRFYMRDQMDRGWDVAKLGEPWDYERDGQPICQEDLAGTLMAFSSLTIHGLRSLGLPVTDEQAEAYSYTWKTVGRIMGIQEAILPLGYEDGWNLGLAIIRRHAAESEWGQMLTKSVMDLMRSMLPGNRFGNCADLISKKLLDTISADLGFDITKILGVHADSAQETETMYKALQEDVRQIVNKEERSFLVRRFFDVFNRALLQGMVNHYNEEKKVHFYLPPSLTHAWELAPVWKDTLRLRIPLMQFRLSLQHRVVKLDPDDFPAPDADSHLKPA